MQSPLIASLPLPLILSASFVAAACISPETASDTQASSTPTIASCPIPATAEDIAGRESEFYWCAEDLADSGQGCGPDGYLAGYGAVYAERFYQVTRPRMTARGRAWIDDVLVCLQRELSQSIDTNTSCEDIRAIAFDSHPRCYIDAGFCTLHPWDILNVVWTVDGSDWVSSGAAKQAVQTALGCGRQYSGALWWFFGHLMD